MSFTTLLLATMSCCFVLKLVYRRIRSWALFLKTMVLLCLLAFFFLSQNSEFSNCGSPMNSSSYIPRENIDDYPDNPSCFYCKRKFGSNWALSGHLRFHQNSNISKSSSSNPSPITSTNNNSLFNSPLDNSSGRTGKIPLVSREVSSLGFVGRFRSPGTSMANKSRFPGNNLENALSVSMSPNSLSLNSVAKMYQSNTALTSVAGTSAYYSSTWLPSRSSLCLPKKERYPFNSNEFQTWKDDLHFSSKNELANLRSYDLCELPHPEFVNPEGLGVNQFSLNQPFMGSFPQGPKNPIPDEAGPLKKRLSCDGNKVPYLVDVSRDAIMMVKRPKISSRSPLELEKPQKKEFPLKDEKRSSYKLMIWHGVQEEGQPDLDLSLHL